MSNTDKTVATTVTATTVNPTRQFGISLFKKEAAAAKGKNVLISPASVAIALAMTMNGARATTLSAMKTTLGFGDSDSLEAINNNIGAIIAALTDPNSGVELNVANAIWAEQSMAFKADFLKGVVDAYRATITNADFAAESTKDDINKWASDNTKGKIPTIIDKIDPNMVMYLLNAIYFKGQWSTQFDKDRTWDNSFTGEDGKVSTVPFMWREDEMRYTRGNNYSAAVLPFGTAKQVALYVILPNEDVEINDFIESLDQSILTGVKGGYETEVALYMPRFTLESDVDLKDSLGAMGMQEAFDSGANFTGMANAALKISTVKHKTFAKFDEEGGEAAAVTAVGMTLECVSMTPTLMLNRPFIIALVDEKSDSLLFAGKVAEICS